jgi:hypothetical protein
MAPAAAEAAPAADKASRWLLHLCLGQLQVKTMQAGLAAAPAAPAAAPEQMMAASSLAEHPTTIDMRSAAMHGSILEMTNRHHR